MFAYIRKQEVATQQTVLPQVSALLLAGFTMGEARSLLESRDRYQAGRLSEETPEHKRLVFARWLYENGYIGA